MLIPVWLYKGLFYGLLASAGLAVLYYAYRPKRDEAPERIPRAEVHGSKWKQHALVWLPRVMLLVGGIGAWAIHTVAVDVIRVRDDGGEPIADRMKHLGKPSYPFPPGRDRETLVGYDQWVINESSRAVRIETFSYGRFSIGLGGKSPPTMVPPGTAVMTSSIDFIGPHNSPPSSLAVEGFEAKVGMTSRSWLTWDVSDGDGAR